MININKNRKMQPLLAAFYDMFVSTVMSTFNVFL